MSLEQELMFKRLNIMYMLLHPTIREMAKNYKIANSYYCFRELCDIHLASLREYAIRFSISMNDQDFKWNFESCLRLRRVVQEYMENSKR